MQACDLTQAWEIIFEPAVTQTPVALLAGDGPSGHVKSQRNNVLDTSRVLQAPPRPQHSLVRPMNSEPSAKVDKPTQPFFSSNGHGRCPKPAKGTNMPDMSLPAARSSEQRRPSGRKTHAPPHIPTVKPKPLMPANQATAGRSTFPIPNPLTHGHITESMPGHTLRPSSPWHRTPSQMHLAAAPESASNPSVVIDKEGYHPTIAETLGFVNCTDATPVHQTAAASGAQPALDAEPLPVSQPHSKTHNPNSSLHKRRW